MLTIETIDSKQLDSVTGGVRPGPNGEGCTQQGPNRPRPFPRPTNPITGGPRDGTFGRVLDQ